MIYLLQDLLLTSTCLKLKVETLYWYANYGHSQQ